ncbi:MAG TPA: NAD-dependent epimerase/dehydratase family protein, partial [Pyrinomonadaceae bacterium]|nr:NAD-dependent epimerase/dehydratase family protein [Pyrinomonadaceae bacterium]
MSEARVSRGRVVLAGGSGFLGRALAEELARAGYEPVVLTRELKKNSRVRQVGWDGRNVGAWARELEGAAAVVNLAGRG